MEGLECLHLHPLILHRSDLSAPPPGPEEGHVVGKRFIIDRFQSEDFFVMKQNKIHRIAWVFNKRVYRIECGHRRRLQVIDGTLR